MPTATYYNLPEEKQQRIWKAAVDEFAAHRFSEASINRIVKNAGIARGSFYQYFDGKEDLYLMILEQISREKLAVFANHPAPSPDVTFFQAAVASIPAILEWVARCPQYNQIGMLMTQDDSEFMQRMIRQMAGVDQGVMMYLRRDQQRGLIRADVDLQLVVDLLLPATTSLLRDYYTEGGAERALEKIKAVFSIIAHGIEARKE